MAIDRDAVYWGPGLFGKANYTRHPLTSWLPIGAFHVGELQTDSGRRISEQTRWRYQPVQGRGAWEKAYFDAICVMHTNDMVIGSMILIIWIDVMNNSCVIYFHMWWFHHIRLRHFDHDSKSRPVLLGNVRQGTRSSLHNKTYKNNESSFQLIFQWMP